jgi:RimJ/RimL family protein N-acetyltransferase
VSPFNPHRRRCRKSYGGEIVVEPLELLTERLRLRTPQIADADAIQSIVADPRVALTTASIPHPYPEGGANWAGVTIKWDNRSLQTILHNDMAQVQLVPVKA